MGLLSLALRQRLIGRLLDERVLEAVYSLWLGGLLIEELSLGEPRECRWEQRSAPLPECLEQGERTVPAKYRSKLQRPPSTSRQTAAVPAASSTLAESRTMNASEPPSSSTTGLMCRLACSPTAEPAQNAAPPPREAVEKRISAAMGGELADVPFRNWAS